MEYRPTPIGRRNFIQALSLLTVKGLIPKSLFSPKMKLGLVTYLWGKDWDVPTLITNCTKAQIEGVELRIDHAHKVSPELSGDQRKEVRKRFEDSKVKFVGMGTNQAYHYTDPTRLRAEIEGTKAFIKLSYDIGGTGVKVKPNEFPKGIAKEKTIEQIGKSLNEVGAFAADYGQKIRVEVHGNETQELPNMRAIMDVANHPNVYTCWNSNPEDLIGEGLVHNFNLVKHRQGDTVHVRELDDKSYPYQELMNLLMGMDYSGWVLLECRTEPQDRVQAMIDQRKIWMDMMG